MKRNKYPRNISIYLIFLLNVIFLYPSTTFAVGPRVSSSLFSTNENTIFAIDLPALITTDMHEQGLVIELIKTIMQQEQIEPNITVLPLLRLAQYYIKEENALAVVGRHLNLDVKQTDNFIYIPVYVTDENYYYSISDHKSGLDWQGKLDSLSGLTYGASKGENIGVYQQSKINVAYGKVYTLFKKLESNKVDFIRMPALSADWIIKNEYGGEEIFAEMATDAGEETIFIIFNKRHQKGIEVANTFKAGLNKIIRNGKYKRVLKKHSINESSSEDKLNKLNKYLK